jgi:cell division protein FtsI (penicillin-binding protein 3)
MQRTDKAAAQLRPTAFHPQAELPDKLPEGAHRVISTMTAAQMRKMMEGVVLFGTAKGDASLNGYTSGGKTGTAQKIDVLTHRYSKTKYIASFVGIAPVNNPAISVAVIIDSPEGNHYGNVNAAPVFREVAQEALEYLGVPHDTSLAPEKDLAKGQAEPKVEEVAQESTGDLNALFSEVNNLPADDPLRQPQTGGDQDSAKEPERPAAPKPEPAMIAQAPVVTSPAEEKPEKEEKKDPTPAHGVVVSANRVGVPSFVGESLRNAIESAGTARLTLQIVGSGIAREQVPAAGSQVPPGTEVVVRFSR